MKNEETTLHCENGGFGAVISCTGPKGAKIFASLKEHMFEDYEKCNCDAEVYLFRNNALMLTAVKEYLGDDSPMVIHSMDLFKLQEKEGVHFYWRKVQGLIAIVSEPEVDFGVGVKNNYEHIFGERYPLKDTVNDSNTNQLFSEMLIYNKVIEDLTEYYNIFVGTQYKDRDRDISC